MRASCCVFASVFVIASGGCGFPGYTAVGQDSTVADDTAVAEVADEVEVADVAVETSANACDGSVVLDGAPDAGCGVCNTAKLSCAGPDSLKCSQADDRAVVIDSSYVSNFSSRAFDHRSELAIGYPLHRQSTPGSIQLTIARGAYSCGFTSVLPHPDPACDTCTAVPAPGTGYNCSVGKPSVGALKVRLFRGQPTTGGAMTALAEVSVASDTLPDLNQFPPPPTTFNFGLDVNAPPFPISASVYVTISTTSTAYAFILAGDRTRNNPPPPDVSLWTRTLVPSTSSWVLESGGGANRTFPAYRFEVRGCF